jgi:hypothetical protein
MILTKIIINMKNLKILFVIAFYLGIISCIDGQSFRTVRGDGNVVKEERSAPYFDGIRVASGIDVYLKQGNDESITVEADENLHDYIITEVENGILRVRTDRVNIRSAERKRVYVTMKDVKSLKTSSAGDLVGETPIRSDDIELGASSAGDIKLELYATNVKLNISSSGDIDLSGEAETLDASLSSAGDLSAYNFKVKTADVSASSAGDANIYVTERLVARASSAGDISYQGHPEFVDAHSSSAGSIRGR